jgi:hypothetical protein
MAKDNWFNKNKTGMIIGAVIGLLIIVFINMGLANSPEPKFFVITLLLVLIPLFLSRLIPSSSALAFDAVIILSYSLIGLVISMIINSMRGKK